MPDNRNKYFSLLLFLFVLPVYQLKAQSVVNTWQSYSSLRTVTHISLDKSGTIWCATTGGLFSFKNDTMQSRYTNIDGMYNVNPTAMAYDAVHNGLWMGYNDGTIEFFDIKDQSFTQYKDIYRATRYNPRGINAMKMKGDTVLIATDFGVVLFDSNKDFVLDTYPNLGNFDSGIKVNDIDYAGSKIYCATDQGIAIGDETAGDLVVPSNWQNYDGNNGYTDSATNSIGYYDGWLYATASNGQNYQFDGSNWTNSTVFPSIGITKYKRTNNDQRFLAVSPTNAYVLTKSALKSIKVSKGQPLLSAEFSQSGNTTSLIVGTSTEGLAIINDFNNLTVNGYFAPEGPYLNLFSGLNVVDGVLISGSGPVPGKAVSSIRSTGYYIYKDSKWENYNLSNNSILAQNNINSVYISTYNDQSYYFGSWGRGIVEHNKKTKKITVYGTSSGLEGVPQNNNFIVISGIAEDTKGVIWAVSYLAPNTPLFYHEQGSDNWIGLRRSPVVSSTEIYNGLMIDSYDQKWISLKAPGGSGDGILVLDTGDPTTPNDDKAYHLTTNIDQGFLPDDNVNAMVEDKRGEVWVGTDRGVVHYLFPDRIIEGSVNDRRSEFLRKAGTDSLILRDLHATSIAVDAANRKWIGSQGDGVWLVSASGDQVLQHFTAENSPLISDNIISLAIDDNTGTVYMATDEGLVSYVSVVKAAQKKMKKLFIYPNPYSYARGNSNIIIDKLSEQTTIRVLTVDGQLVKKINAQGGRAEWDGRDYNGHKLPTGVYLIVALDKQNNEKGVGKIVIVR
jgi:hypothetical protein